MDQIGDAGFDHLSRGEPLEVGARGDEAALDIFRSELGAEQCALHGIGWIGSRARVFQMQVIDGESRAQRCAGIAGGGLNPDTAKAPVAEDFAVDQAVPCDASGQAQVFETGLGSQSAGHAQHDLLENGLNRRGQVGVPLRDAILGPARPASEQRMEARVGHGQAGAKIEVIQVQAKGAVGLYIDEVFADLGRVDAFAIGRQAHQFVFPGVDLEAGIVGEGRIQQTERVRVANFPQQLQFPSASDAETCRGPFACAVQGEHRGGFKRAREEGAGCVTLVMFGEQQLAVPLGIHGVEPVQKQRPLDSLAVPGTAAWMRRRRQSRGRKAQVGLDLALKLGDRFFVEDGVIDLMQAHARVAQATGDGFFGNGVVPDAVKRPPGRRRRSGRPR